MREFKIRISPFFLASSPEVLFRRNENRDKGGRVRKVTYEIMPPIAMMTPRTDLSPTARPLASHPRATMQQVLTWPTTVLETGPA